MVKAKKTSGKKVSKEIAKVNAEMVDTDSVKEIVNIQIDSQTLSGAFRTFSSGSKGWYINGKVSIDGVKCQVSCNIIVIGSKPAEVTNGKK